MNQFLLRRWPFSICRHVTSFLELACINDHEQLNRIKAWWTRRVVPIRLTIHPRYKFRASSHLGAIRWTMRRWRGLVIAFGAYKLLENDQ